MVLVKMVLIQHLFGIPSVADAPGVRGECGVPMVSGLRAVGQAPAFCDGKLCGSAGGSRKNWQ